MKRLIILFSLVFGFYSLCAQVILPGKGVGALRIGQSFEEMRAVLGFKGEIKTYDDYLDEVLFTENPDDVLECNIGFDYYIKFEHLLTLPVSYVYFRNNKINQMRVTSLPAYYRAIAEDMKTAEGLPFWADGNKVREIYGAPDYVREYHDFMFKAWFYFKKGIVLNFREGNYRAAHIFEPPSEDLIKKFTGK